MPVVVRPKGVHTTPEKVKDELGSGWRLRYYPNPDRPNRQFVYTRDFLMMPVAPQHLLVAPSGYNVVYNFAQMNKYGQRKALNAFQIKTPKAAADHDTATTLDAEKFVVRPLRHSRGVGYRVTEDRLDFVAGSEYISELFPKRREYRVIFVFGQPLIWMRKKQNEGVTHEDPWGHTNSVFQTINDTAGSRLAATDCVASLSGCPVVRASHIVAADILWNDKHPDIYSVLELNFCPGLDIDTNRAKVVEAIRGR